MIGIGVLALLSLVLTVVLYREVARADRMLEGRYMEDRGNNVTSIRGTDSEYLTARIAANLTDNQHY